MQRLTFGPSFRGTVAAGVLAAAMGGSLAAPTQAATLATLGTLDISDVAVTPPGTVARTLLLLGAGMVTSVYFDFTLTHNAPSWLSETEITVIAPDGAEQLYGGMLGTFGFPEEGPGTQSFSGSLDFGLGGASAEGLWTFVFSDNFEDAVSPNYFFWDGSRIELRGTGGDVGVIPLPATLPLLLGALGALALVRRRMATAV